MLSLVVPCYNEEGNVHAFYNEVCSAFEGRVDKYEFVFVNDGSSDKTYQRLKEIHALSPQNVQVLCFSRNFGKESAIYAGLSHAKGDLVCLIDADLQQRPQVVLEMLDVLNANPELDCVTAYQKKRKENKLMSAIKSGFYKFINKISDVRFVNGASDFRLMKRNMVNAILQMTEFHRFSKGIFSYVGFNTEYIPYEAAKRESGQSKWGTKKLIKYALEGIFAFSTSPLKMSTYVGFTSSLLSIAYLIFVIIQKLAFGIDVPGYATIVVLVLLIGGIQLFCLGVLGEYIAKMYVQAKNRPVYILKDKLEAEENNNEQN
ncbi:MAG: glycosyltransferase family 2 protein [Clostridia bacterium]|nr:glycosyltransferase family 2 protein [Clostridia bacterium]